MQLVQVVRDLGEFGVAHLHVIEFVYKTPYRCRAENACGSDWQVKADLRV